MKNFNWQEADQLAVDMRGVEPGTSKDNQLVVRARRERDNHGLLRRLTIVLGLGSSRANHA